MEEKIEGFFLSCFTIVQLVLSYTPKSLGETIKRERCWTMDERGDLAGQVHG